MADTYPSTRGVSRASLPQLSYFTGGAGVTGFGSKTTAEQVVADWDGAGKVVVITGASSGLGAESTRVLAARGATIVLLVRQLSLTQKMVDDVRATYSLPAERFHIIECKLESLPSVTEAAKKVLALNLPINVLMLNAGIMAPPFGTTEQGIEMQIGVNHVAHALLTRYLLPNMVASASAPGAPESRIVSLSSSGHRLAPPHGMRSREKINTADGYNHWIAYGQAKLANILFPRELAKRLSQAGVKNVVAVSCHPGVIPTTNLPRHTVIMNILRPLLKPLFKTIPSGTATQVYLSTTPGHVAPGDYYADCNPAPSSKLSHDAALGAKLWSWTEEQLKPYVAADVGGAQPITW